MQTARAQADPARRIGAVTVLHVIGAGLAGLACAVTAATAGARVQLYEAARLAGGRCRSFHDRIIGRTIDNGNHLILGGNLETFRYLDMLGARDRVMAVDPPSLPFLDLNDGSLWRLRSGPGALLPWFKGGAVPGTTRRELLRLFKLMAAGPRATVAQCLGPAGTLYERLWEPLSVSALNTEADAASAALFRRTLAQSLLRGSGAGRPFIVREGLGHAFIEPALDFLGRHGCEVAFGRRLGAVEFSGSGVAALQFSDAPVALGSADRVVLAVPPWAALDLVPGLAVPAESRAIVNAHFRLAAPAHLPGGAHILGLVGGLAQWIFMRGDVASVTVSAGDALAARTQEDIAACLWRDVARVLDLPDEPPPHRIIKERRATPAQTPDFVAHRQRSQTAWANLFLAGDWTETRLPATIEGAIRSGVRAARLALA